MTRKTTPQPTVSKAVSKLIQQIHAEAEAATLELAALQGENDQDWRERIGNAVPSAAATAIADVMGETLLLAQAGETFQLSSRPVWVRPVVMALSVRTNP